MGYIEDLKNQYKIPDDKLYKYKRGCSDALTLYTYNLGRRTKKPPMNYTLLLVPTEVLKDLVMQVDYVCQFPSFDAYHQYYKSKKELKMHEQIIPLILDREFDCVIEDGWGRFHSYVEQGVTSIPCMVLE